MARFPARTRIGRRTRATKPAINTYTTSSAPQGDFTLAESPEGEVSYQSVNGTAYPDSKTVIFDAANATAGTMKRRGRKKAE